MEFFFFLSKHVLTRRFVSSVPRLDRNESVFLTTGAWVNRALPETYITARDLCEDHLCTIDLIYIYKGRVRVTM